jgi:acylphosphatase
MYRRGVFLTSRKKKYEEFAFRSPAASISQGRNIFDCSSPVLLQEITMDSNFSTTTRTLHLVIRGRVQGVFFRNSMQREAMKLGVAGWVRNCSDGAVEAVVQGESDAVEAIVRWAHQGPEIAQVTHVDVAPGAGDFSHFEIME